jgi:hypothetical protein
MATIHALKGPRHCGKSSTLIALLRCIESAYPQAARQYHRAHGKVDVTVILSSVKGLKIGLASQGDPNSKLEESLQIFRSAKCDIIFCACRTSGKTVKLVEDMDPPYTVNFVLQTKAGPRAQQAANAATVTGLMNSAGI